MKQAKGRTGGLKFGELEWLPARRARAHSPPRSRPSWKTPIAPSLTAIDLGYKTEVGVVDPIAPLDSEVLRWFIAVSKRAEEESRGHKAKLYVPFRTRWV